MANTLKHKRSSTTGETPAASELEVGEIAVNTADAKLFVKHTDNSVKEISGQDFSTVASSSDLGLVKIGYTESGKNYPVELSADNQMFVNVPWTDTDTDTTYSIATTSTAGLIKVGYTESGKNYPVELDSNDKAYVNVPWTDTDTNTTYTAGTGLDLSGTEFSLSSTISGARTFSDNVTISGNLTVSGSTTTVNSGTINLADSILTLNSDLDSAVAPTENAGFEVNRGSSDNVSLVWDETDDRFEVKGVSQLTFNVEGTGGSSSYSQIRARNPDDGAGHQGAEVYLRSYGWGEGRLQVGGWNINQTGGRMNAVTGNQTLYINTGTGAGVGILNSGPTALLTVGNGGSFTLGGTAGNTKHGLDLQYDSQNTDYLRFYMKRKSDGSDWQSADHYIQRRVDSTNMGFIKFGNHGLSDLISFGKNATEYMQLTSSGQLNLFNKFTVDTAQNSNAPMASPHLHLEASSTTNTTGLTSIRMDTSTVDNYGVSINAARKGTNGVPTFQIRMHNNSSTGLSSFEIDSTGNLHMPAWIKHIQDSNTQFGFPSNDTFVVSTGGNYRFEVKNGTDGPTTRTYGLHESDENRERISGDGYVDGGTGGIIRYFKWGFEIGSSANGYKGITINGGKYKYFELEANIKGDSSANHQGFFWGNAVNNAYYGSSTTGYKLTHQNSTNFHIRDVNSNSNQTTINPGFGPNDGVWHHYKLTVTPDGYVRVYLDGDKVIEATGYIPSAAGYVGFLNYAGLAQFNNVQFRALTDDYVEVVDQIGLSDKIYHNGDTNNYMQFHATDQWRVVTSGSERLEVTNTTVMARGDNNVGFTNDGAAKHYAWRAVNNTSGVSNQWYKIARIVGSQSTRFKIDIVGHQTSYADGTQAAMSTLVGSLNNDNNYDIASYTTKNASGQSPVEQWGQVDVSTSTTDIYVKTDNFSEIAAWAIISDGTIQTVSNATNADGVSTEPTGYSAATDYEIWHSGSDGSGSGLDADTLDGNEASAFVSKSGDTMTGNLTIDQGTAGDANLTLRADTDNNDESDHPSIRFKQDGDLVDYRIGLDYGDAASHSGNGNNGLVITNYTSSDYGFWYSPDGGTNVHRVFHDGYHPNADKWTTARTLTLSGDASGSVSWDGSANATLSVTVANDSHTHDGRYYRDHGLTSISDYNSLSEGVYVTNTTNASNIPYANYNGTWQLSDTASDRHYQIYMGDTSAGGLRFRAKQGSTNGWHDWEKVWTDVNDGSGSGLDADKLDGHHASSFATSGHTHSNYVENSGDTITGRVYLDHSYNDKLFLRGSDNPSIEFQNSSDAFRGRIGVSSSQEEIRIVGQDPDDTNGIHILGVGSNGVRYSPDNGTTQHKVWHAGNDGSGSGLDADKLDGYHASSFATSAQGTKADNALPKAGGTMTGALVLRGQANDYDGNDRSSYWDYDANVALALEPAADNGATAILFKSIGNSPSDFAYIAYDEDYGEAGVTAGEAGALILSAQNDGAGSSDHVRVKSRLVVEADMSSSDPTMAFQVKSSNTTSDLLSVARSNGDVNIAGYVKASSLKTSSWTIDQNSDGDLEFIYA